MVNDKYKHIFMPKTGLIPGIFTGNVGIDVNRNKLFELYFLVCISGF